MKKFLFLKYLYKTRKKFRRLILETIKENNLKVKYFTLAIHETLIDDEEQGLEQEYYLCFSLFQLRSHDIKDTFRFYNTETDRPFYIPLRIIEAIIREDKDFDWYVNCQ